MRDTYVAPQTIARYHGDDYAGETLLGRGAYRVVYVYDAVSVLKVTKSDHSIRQSEAEVSAWQNRIRRSPDEHKFARLIEWTDDYTMIRAERIVRTAADYLGIGPDIGCTLSWDELLDRMRPVPEIWNIVQTMRDYGMDDTHPWNIGQRADGSWCVIDYGM